MKEYDVIIIGAGAAGLLAGKELCAAGFKACILEARDRIGGRIYSIENAQVGYLEAGAEFIHGHLPVCFQLIKEAGLSTTVTGGDLLNYKNGAWQESVEFIRDEELFVSKMQQLKIDMSMAAFLEEYFPGDKYSQMRNSVLRYIEGYDAADASRLSTFAFREEWSSDQDKQYRMKMGYGSLTGYLANSISKNGGEIRLSSIVKKVEWVESKVIASLSNGEMFSAKKMICTIPLGILTAGSEQQASVSFSPAIPAYIAAANHIGFGAVIKIQLIFKRPFWKDKAINRESAKKEFAPGFIISDSAIPTWWSQEPDLKPMLTGWFAGPNAQAAVNTPNEIVIERAIESLAYIFNVTTSWINEVLSSAEVFNWTADPFSLGAYAYSTVDTPGARKVLNEPVEKTIYFAGEALYDGAEMGTVEAAFANGQSVAQSIIKSMGESS